MNMKELAKKYNLTESDYWQESRSKKWIITHDACQKIAHIESITFAPPQIINSEKDLVRMVVTGKKGDVIFFDATGYHSGNICQKGMRLDLFLSCPTESSFIGNFF